MMNRFVILPNGGTRTWLTLLGTVAGYKTIDERNFIMKFLATKFPSVQMFQEGIHLMVEVEIDRESCEKAEQKVKLLDGRINGRSAFKISSRDLAQYPVEKILGVTFGFCGTFQQELFGYFPVVYELHQVGSEEEFLKLPDPILPAQRTLFLQI